MGQDEGHDGHGKGRDPPGDPAQTDPDLETAATEPIEQAKAPQPEQAPAEPQPAGQQAGHRPRMDDQQAQNWAVGAHLSGLSWLVSIPGLIGPLVIWLVKGSEHGTVERHAKEALNFQLSLMIYGLVAFALVFTIIGILVAIPMVIGILILGLIWPIVAAIKTSDGRDYRYPLTMRLIT